MEQRCAEFLPHRDHRAHLYQGRPETGKPLVDVILDKAGQKGTGKWTVGHAVELGVPLSVISSAVEARILSSLKDERVEASATLPAPEVKPFTGDRQELIDAVRDALYASKIISYAQGFVQLGVAAKLYDWNLNFGDIASIWRGGCIIRAQFLNRITEAYRRNPALKNLILDPYFTEIIVKTQATGATPYRPPSGTVWPLRPSPPRSATTTAIARPVCPPTCSRPSATTLARTPTSAWTSRPGSFSTRNGSPISSKTAENSAARKFFSEISRGRTNRAAPLFIGLAGGRVYTSAG